MKSLSPVLLLAFLATILSACCSAAHPPDPPVIVDTRTRAERVEAMSVAVLDDENDPICGGVWISPTTIVTKSHCVKDAGRPSIYEMAEALGVDMRLPPWSAVGAKVSYANRAGEKFVSVVQVIDTDSRVDLAILFTWLYPKPPHDIAYVSDRELRDGEELDVVGSTFGEPFTYSRCYVAASRLDWLQVSGPVYRGNSGGGAFDDAGHLVGIADHMKGYRDGTLVPGMSFFSTGRAVREFIAAAENTTAVP